ncbi:tetraspanin-1-like [Colossoma macropomum]|uniref:tetraspanin-1-like n=1 Tax=Colossoma macropomum TaxID=42526 RepID=UPI001864CFAE|nr:tetraspanin-1-like [Colossoma macropomum]XP_036420751.1 tetraspanin-1-like [Colossoma macropomum]
MWILKVIMCVFNGVIFLAGGVAVSVGILVEMNSKYLRTVLDHIKDSPPALAQVGNVGYLLIAVGAVLAIMGFLGCCGALCESKCMLLTFFIIILIVFLAEVAGAVIILLFQPTAQKLLEEIRQKAAQSIKSSYGENKVLTTAWNETMNLMKCCGYNNYNDFTDSPFVKHNSQYPNDCCHGKPAKCTYNEARIENVTGCFDALAKLVKDNSNWLAGVAICIAAIEVCAMIVAILLYKN